MSIIRSLSFVFLLVTCVLSAAQDNWNVEKKGNVYNISNSKDTVSHLNHYSDQYIEQLKSQYNGLQNERRLNNLLRSQNYIEVLNYLWSEENQNKKIAWLEKKHNESHPILIFELAKEYFFKDPSLETYFFHSLPLISAGMSRVYVDCACTSDESVGAATGFLEMAYIQLILDVLYENYTPDELGTFCKEHYLEFWSIKKEYVEQILAPFLYGESKKVMPSPEWVFSHGVGSFLGEEQKAAFHSEDWTRIRKETAEEVMQLISEIDAEIARDPENFIEEAFSFEEDEY